jgi:protein gp37
MTLAGTRLKHHESRAGLTRESKAGPVWTGEVRLNKQWLHQPIDWKKPRRIFVCAHGDLFAENVPDEWILDVFTVMAIASQHTFQVLTKRPDRMREFLSRPDLLEDIYANWYTFSGGAREVYSWPLHNVWCGASAEDQLRYDSRRRHLDETPAAVRFWSIEPMLGAIDLNIQHIKPDWVIVGGESGPGARPMHPAWVRSIRDQCAAAGVPYFFKQWGDWTAFYDRVVEDPDWRHVPHVDNQMGRGAERWLNLAGGCGFHGERLVAVRNVGKKSAGRLLDLQEHSAIPESRQ